MRGDRTPAGHARWGCSEIEAFVGGLDMAREVPRLEVRATLTIEGERIWA